MRIFDFCISHAAVGQRSAHSPQCTQTSSSLTITRAVCCNGAETNNGCLGCSEGAFNRCRKSVSSQLGVMVKQSTGQISMHASHSIHSLASNTVCTSQFRQRCTSAAACSAVKPSSTS